jgi:hypothetical protein
MNFFFTLVGSDKVMMQFKLDINRTVIYPDGKPNLRKTVTINGVPFGKESGKESKGDELSLLMMQVVKTHLLSVAREEYDPVNLQADVLLIFDKMHQGIQAFIMRKMLDVCGRVPDATLYAGFYDSTSYSLTINKDERSLTIVYKIEFIDFDGIAERQSKGAKLQDEESYENFIQRLPANQKALGLIEACLTLDPLKPEDARIKINFHPHNEEGKKLVHSLIPQGPGSVRKAAARFSSWVSEKFSPVKLRKEEPQSSS